MLKLTQVSIILAYWFLTCIPVLKAQNPPTSEEIEDIVELATGAIVGIVIAGIVLTIGIPVLICCCCGLCCFAARKKKSQAQVHYPPVQVVTQQVPGPTVYYPAPNQAPYPNTQHSAPYPTEQQAAPPYPTTQQSAPIYPTVQATAKPTESRKSSSSSSSSSD